MTIFDLLNLSCHVAESLPCVAAGLIVLAVVVKRPRVLWAIAAGVR